MSESDVHMMTRAGPVIRTIKFIGFVSIILLALQVYLNPPEKRGSVLCWPPYKVSNLVGVDAFKIIAPREHTAHLKVITFNERAYYACANGAAKWLPGFEDPKLHAKSPLEVFSVPTQ